MGHRAGILVAAVTLLLAITGSSPAQDRPAPVASPSAKEGTEILVVGRRNFESHCAVCHGLDGRGAGRAPGIANSKSVQARSDAALAQTIRAGIPSAGMPSFGSLSDNETNALVRYLRRLGGKAALPVLKGNPGRGSEIFFHQAQCSDCHMMNGKGGFIASDLTDFAQSHSPEELRKAILKPRQALPAGQEMVTVMTRSGQALSGLVRNEDNFSLQLEGLDGTFHLLMKSQLTKIDRTPHSLMPTDYRTRLSATDLDDLVSYIVRKARPGVSSPRSSHRRRRRPSKGEGKR